jgi:8-oxo-dGTP diphosphatase
LLLLLYITRKWTGVPRALEATALRWVRPNEMHSLPMPPADRPLIGLLDALI